MNFSARLERYEGLERKRAIHERIGRDLLVADGAMGTMLQAEGLPAGEPPEHWNLTRPEAVQAVHRAYLGIGCDLVETNTFGANRLRLKAYGLDKEVAAINERGVELARKACDAGQLVAGAVGPTDGFYGGRQNEATTGIASAFEEQLSYLVQAGVDLIVIETMTHLAEARIALDAARKCSIVPIAVSLTFFERRGDLRTLDGASPQEAVRELSDAQIVGCNCMDPDMAGEVLRQMREATDLPLIAQPHAGQTHPLTPQDIVHHLPAFVASNVGILGGCCGTTPAHLEAVVSALRRP